MSFEIPVANLDGVPVVRVVWDGDLYEGAATVASIVGYEEKAAQLRNMIRLRQDLRDLHFRSEGTRYWTRGWSGYEGVVGALRILLPAMQLQVGHVGGDSPPLGTDRTDEVAFNYDEGGIE